MSQQDNKELQKQIANYEKGRQQRYTEPISYVYPNVKKPSISSTPIRKVSMEPINKNAKSNFSVQKVKKVERTPSEVKKSIKIQPQVLEPSTPAITVEKTSKQSVNKDSKKKFSAQKVKKIERVPGEVKKGIKIGPVDEPKVDSQALKKSTKAELKNLLSGFAGCAKGVGRLGVNVLKNATGVASLILNKTADLAESSSRAINVAIKTGQARRKKLDEINQMDLEKANAKSEKKFAKYARVNKSKIEKTKTETEKLNSKALVEEAKQVKKRKSLRAKTAKANRIKIESEAKANLTESKELARASLTEAKKNTKAEEIKQKSETLAKIIQAEHESKTELTDKKAQAKIDSVEANKNIELADITGKAKAKELTNKGTLDKIEAKHKSDAEIISEKNKAVLEEIELDRKIGLTKVKGKAKSNKLKRKTTLEKAKGISKVDELIEKKTFEKTKANWQEKEMKVKEVVEDLLKTIKVKEYENKNELEETISKKNKTIAKAEREYEENKKARESTDILENEKDSNEKAMEIAEYSKDLIQSIIQDPTLLAKADENGSYLIPNELIKNPFFKKTMESVINDKLDPKYSESFYDLYKLREEVADLEDLLNQKELDKPIETEEMVK